MVPARSPACLATPSQRETPRALLPPGRQYRLSSWIRDCSWASAVRPHGSLFLSVLLLKLRMDISHTHSHTLTQHTHTLTQHTHTHATQNTSRKGLCEKALSQPLLHATKFTEQILVSRPCVGPSHWVMDKTLMLLCPFYSREGHASRVPERARCRGTTTTGALQPRLSWAPAPKGPETASLLGSEPWGGGSG